MLVPWRHVANAGYVVAGLPGEGLAASSAQHSLGGRPRRLGFRSMQFNLVLKYQHRGNPVAEAQIGFRHHRAPCPGAFRHRQLVYVDAYVNGAPPPPARASWRVQLHESWHEGLHESGVADNLAGPFVAAGLPLAGPDGRATATWSSPSVMANTIRG